MQTRPFRWPLVLGALLVLAAASVLALPWALSKLLTHQLPLQATQALGRPVSLDAAEVGLWPPRVVLQGLSIGTANAHLASAAAAAAPPTEAPPHQPAAAVGPSAAASVPAAGPVAPSAGDPPLFTLARAEVQLATGASLRHRALVLDGLRLTGPRLAVARTGPGRTSIDDLLARWQRPQAADAAGPSPAWAVYNLQVSDGAVHLDDRVAGRQHRVEALTLALPFVSALAADVAVHVQPALALQYNGRPLRAEGRSLPFAPDRASDLSFKVDGLDLAPLAVYLPSSLPVRLQQGRLDLRLRAQFRQAPAPTPAALDLSGELGIQDAALTDAQGQAVARWQSLQVPVETLRPLARQVALGDIRWQGLNLPLVRQRDGQWPLLRVVGPAPGQDKQAQASPTPAPSPPGWTATVKSFALSDGLVSLDDRLPRPAVALQAERLALSAGALAWPLTAPAQLQASTTLRQAGQTVGVLSAKAEADLAQARLSLDTQNLVLATAQPYLAPFLAARLTGTAAAQLQLDWAANTPGVQLALQRLALDHLALGGPGLPTARLASLRLNNSHLDLGRHRLALGQLVLDRPQLQATRQADGQWDLQRWWVAPPADTARGAAAARPASAPTSATATAAVSAPAATPWRLALDELLLQSGQLQLTDLAVPGADTEPVRLNLSALRLRAQRLAWPSGPAQPASPLSLDTRLASGGGPANARLQWQGQVRPHPLAATGQLKAERLPLHLVDRYASQALGNMTLVRAEASLDSRLDLQDTPQGWRVATQGQLSLSDWQLHLRPDAGGRLDSSSELMSWQTLRLDGLALGLQPGESPRVVVQQASLDDFFSRLVITETGRFNLTDVRGRPASADAQPGSQALAAAPAAGPQADRATAPTAAASATPSATASATSSTTTAAATPVQLDIGGVQLRNGRVDFTDRFIRPNYSARLTMLNGELGRFRSDSPELASLSLTGRAADTALLDIRGQINPAARPLALDIRARATDLELAPLSPYAGKYAGYAIERGKLSMDVTYKISPSGALEAQNQVILNQLTFGERVASPEATKLPVLLAVALLKDRHGVIDLNLPVSGSLDDPQFSISGLIFKVIGNLLGRALTAPFSLLAGSGGADLSQVGFAPGLTRLATDAPATLDKLAQALIDRSGLSLTITGTADPVSEREAYRDQVLEARLQAEHRRTQAGAGAGAKAEDTPLSADLRARLLRDLYRQSPLPDRPRNAIGLLRELPGPDMANRLKAAIVVSNDTVRELALQRALVVRDGLLSRGVPADRLFLAAPQVRVPAEGDNSAWQPLARMSLATR